MIEISFGYDDLGAVRSLFTEYVTMLGVDLTFQGYDAEFAGLPGDYALPAGCLLLARYNGVIAGCVASRRINSRQCEMKRLFVKPEFRRCGVALALVSRLLAEARISQYKEMLLDTQTTLTGSVELYKKLGFAEIAPYYHNPYENVVYLRRTLGDAHMPVL